MLVLVILLCLLLLLLCTKAIIREEHNIFGNHISSSGILIESGSYLGNGIELGLEYYKQIHSIELSEHYYQHCRYRFSGNDKVHLYLGDSGEKICDILNYINSPVTFWLDGHYSGGDTEKGIDSSPLIRELKCISQHHIKNHIILIDDIRQFSTEHFDNLSLLEVMKTISSINPLYTFKLENGYIEHDILVAKVNNQLSIEVM